MVVKYGLQTPHLIYIYDNFFVYDVLYTVCRPPLHMFNTNNSREMHHVENSEKNLCFVYEMVHVLHNGFVFVLILPYMESTACVDGMYFY